MSTDFRALCVELTDCLEKADWPHQHKKLFQFWIDVARGALTEPDGPAVPDGREPASVATQLTDPEAVVPSDEDLLRTYGLAKRNHCYEGELDDWPKKSERAATVAGIRAALSRYCRTAAAPVPVSERLPGDALCWWYEPDEDDDGSGYGGSWTLLRIRGGVSCYTHWLPANALLTPEATNE